MELQLDSHQSTIPEKSPAPDSERHSQQGGASKLSGVGTNLPSDTEFMHRLDKLSLESVVEIKISRFLDQIGSFYPDDLYDLILAKIEKPFLQQILRRTGNNQAQAAKILGINRNTLRKKMKQYGLNG